jgi:hypothetical protein
MLSPRSKSVNTDATRRQISLKRREREASAERIKTTIDRFFASETSGYITGQVPYADGGGDLY